MNFPVHGFPMTDVAPFARLALGGFAAIMRVSRGKPSHVESRFPAAWRETYDRKSYLLRDPLVAWALTHDGAIDWDNPSLVDTYGVIEDARTHGLRYGATVACGSEECRSFCGMAREDRPFTPEELQSALDHLERLHMAPVLGTAITEPQIEALSIVASGLRYARAAEKLGISESGLKARLRLAKQNLGARTTAEAVHMAQGMGLI